MYVRHLSPDLVNHLDFAPTLVTTESARPPMLPRSGCCGTLNPEKRTLKRDSRATSNDKDPFVRWSLRFIRAAEATRQVGKNIHAYP